MSEAGKHLPSVRCFLAPLSLCLQDYVAGECDLTSNAVRVESLKKFNLDSNCRLM